MLSLTVPETLNDGICYFIALSFDGQTARLYLDGNLKDEKKAESAKSVSTTTGVFHAASTFLISREREQNPQMQYLGKIDEVRLYNWALANLEVKSLMAPTPPKPTYRLYETVGPNPTTTAFLAAHNPTEKEVTIIVSDTAGTKIAQEKIKAEKSLAPVRLTVKIDRKNLKVVWK